VHRAFGELIRSLLCSLEEKEEEHELENGGIGRGQLGRFLAWRSFGSSGPYYLMVVILAWRRAHLRRREHLQLEEVKSKCLSGEVAY
jgi:hypothetical protein